MNLSTCEQWNFSETPETYFKEQAASLNNVVGKSKYPHIEE